jgi:N-acyl-L-homoserine lactone synthetase
MDASAVEQTIVALTNEVSVELADTPDQIREAHRLRYQVYCLERGFEEGRNEMEWDEYDAFARHAIVRLRETGQVVGSVRLILPDRGAGSHGFPIQRVCDPGLFRSVPMATTGEVSRFALAKQIRGSSRTNSLLRLALIRGAVWLSSEAHHTHWLAVMEPTLLRLLRATGLKFDPLGPLVDYHGVRQPAVAELVPVLARLAIEQPAVWEFVTRGGTWYPNSRPRTPCVTRKPAMRFENAAAA